MTSWKEARCGGGFSVLSGELMPLLELEWWFEREFIWTPTKLQGKLTWRCILTLSLAVWLMGLGSGDKPARFHDRHEQIEA